MPLLYLLLAAGWDQALRTPRAGVVAAVLAVLIMVLCMSPWPLSASGNGVIVRHSRESWSFYESPTVAGSPPLAFYAYGTGVRPYDLQQLTPDGSSTEDPLYIDLQDVED